jgi:hypothetical protein
VAWNPYSFPTVRGLPVIPITWDPYSITRIIIIWWIVVTVIDRWRSEVNNGWTKKYSKMGMATRMSTPG